MQQTGLEAMPKRPPPGPADRPVVGAVPPESLQVVFGRNFRDRRLAAGITQIEAAKTASMYRQDISAIEKGRGNLTLKTMERLAAVVDCRVEVLLVPNTKI